VPALAREIEVAEQCSGLIPVPWAQHRVLDEDALTHRADCEQALDGGA
jgi:hypothetical protein